MPFARQTLSELRSGAAQDIAAAMPGVDPLLRFSNMRILGDIIAAMANLHYGYLDWISLQSVPFTATGEFLEAWAGLKNVTRKAAQPWIGTATFTSSATIPGGTPLNRGDGATFTTAADASPVSGTVTVTAQADLAGSAGNNDNGGALTLGTSIVGAQVGGTVASTTQTGTDTETDDELRSRMLEVYANPPQGGAQSDYVEWASEVAGVTRAWVTPNGMGAGTVSVFVMLDDVRSAENGFPQGSNGVAAAETRASAATGDQLQVANAIFPLQPVTALVYVVAPTPNSINFTISGLSGASATLKSQIAAAISDVFLRKGSPGGTVDLSDIEAAIAAIAGTEGFVITIPTGNITNSSGELPVLGTVTYI
ncbi:MAG TPA: baseplate J/gp47 family protein [Rhizomicrobium sp.]|jgi:uncharacterized phage protein gp47/JayE